MQTDKVHSLLRENSHSVREVQCGCASEILQGLPHPQISPLMLSVLHEGRLGKQCCTYVIVNERNGTSPLFIKEFIPLVTFSQLGHIWVNAEDEKVEAPIFELSGLVDDL